jgi:hypothetical protein
MHGITRMRRAAGCAAFVLSCLWKVAVAQTKRARVAIDLVAFFVCNYGEIK